MYVPQIVLKDHPHMTSDGLEYKDLLQSLMKFLLSVITIFFITTSPPDLAGETSFLVPRRSLLE